MRPTRALLLDLGNVTVRLRFEAFCAGLGEACRPRLDPQEAWRVFTDPALGHALYERGRVDGPAWHDGLRRRLGLTLDYPAWLELWNGIFAPNAAMEALVRGLKGRLRVWGLSNTNAEHLAFLREHYPILREFAGLTASCEVGAAKPEAAIYRAALEGLGLEGGDVFYCDDVEDYVQAGRDQGLRAFHYRFNDDALAQALRREGFL